MSNPRAGAYALIVGAILSISLIVVHPLSLAAPILGPMTLNAIVHGTALIATPLIVYGFAQMALALGSDRPLMGVGLSFYVFAAASIILAATIDGFVVPQIAAAYHAAPPDIAASLAPLGNLAHYINQSAAQIYTALASIAVLLWSIEWPAQSASGQLLRLWGTITTLGVLCWQIFGGLVLNVHGMLAVAVLQASWTLAAAGALLRRK